MQVFKESPLFQAANIAATKKTNESRAHILVDWIQLNQRKAKSLHFFHFYDVCGSKKRAFLENVHSDLYCPIEEPSI